MLEQAKTMGLKAEEYEKLYQIMQRTPNLTELGIFASMWSEHCSYKSSKIWLSKMHTTGAQVICGPGENAGIIDIGDDDAVVFKIESHNHPSFIEPFQGAATGVGGIMRDVFTMGAKPIANMNALRFGAKSHPKTDYLLKNVIAGIAHYGNCMGVPTIGGECEFDESYNGNILVNAMTIGLVKKDKITYAKAAGIGNKVVYFGARTGRDGIHGATMSSAEFDDDSAKKRPAIQVGDPFMERLLSQACLELMQTDAIVAIQDMGAAGLTSSSVEMADKGGVGIRLDLDKVPLREANMNSFEIMLSESQERMLMVIAKGKESLAMQILAKWDLSCAIIGELTDTNHLQLFMNGEIQADIPLAPLVHQCPKYERPFEKTLPKPQYAGDEIPLKLAVRPYIKKFFESEHGKSKQKLWRQYDSLISGALIVGGLAKKQGGAAVIKCPDSNKALAISTDCTPRYVMADPFNGGAQAVCESYRNLIAVGAKPIAITNNLNFGNPEKPEIMGQLADAIMGITHACKILNYPVVSGNVSLYNETNGVAIRPTPVIGGVGLMSHYNQSIGMNYESQQHIILIGTNHGEIGASRYAEMMGYRDKFAPPKNDPEIELKHGQFMLGLMAKGLVQACQDVSDGGVIINLIEMAMASEIGFELRHAPNIDDIEYWLSESQALYIVATNNPSEIYQLARDAEINAQILGSCGGDCIIVNGQKLYDLRQIYQFAV